MSEKKKIYSVIYLVFSGLAFYLAYLGSKIECGRYCNDDGSMDIYFIPMLLWYVLTALILLVGAYKIPRKRLGNRAVGWALTILLWAAIIWGIRFIF